MVLHTDEFGPAVALGQRIHLGHLIDVGIGDAYVAGLAGANGFVHAFQYLLSWGLVVPYVVDV